VKVVLDANVLLSGLLQRTTPPRQIMLHWQAVHIEIATSDHILASVHRALSKSYWQARSEEHGISAQLAEFHRLAKFVIPVDDVHGVAEDEEDDLVLATAVAAGADYLVTGDRYLLEIGEFRGTPIVSPRAFLDALAEDVG
jgi:putative PIN family toxin of toxin-antitoxin system